MKLLKIPLLGLAICGFLACSKHAETSIPQPQSPALVVILGSSPAAGIGGKPLDSAWAYRIQGVINKNGKKPNL